MVIDSRFQKRSQNLLIFLQMYLPGLEFFFCEGRFELADVPPAPRNGNVTEIFMADLA